MLTLQKNHQLIIGALLAALLVATRGHHFASITHLPSASWAVFFMAGFYLRPAWVFPAFLAGAAFLDYAAVTWGGVSNFCVTPAYGFLLPAYGALWLAGRWFAGKYSFTWSALMPFFGSTLAGTVLCELLSSGGFYFFGGRYADPTLVEFGTRLAKYFPQSLSGFAFWVGVAMAVHIAFALVRNGNRSHA